MKVQCDVCQNGEASVMCCADEAALCAECDRRIHTANKVASKHQRVGLVYPTSEEPTFCDICQDKAGFFFCLEDRALLCRSCDYSIHSTNALTAKHKRFLVCGIRVALEASPIANESAESTQACPLSQMHSCTTKASELSSPKMASLSKVTSSELIDSQESLPLMSQQTASLNAWNCISHKQAEKCGITDEISLESKKLDQAPSAPSQEDLVVLPSDLASVSMKPFNHHQVHLNSNWEMHPSMNMGRAVANQTGGSGFDRNKSISEYLTETIGGWRVDELISFTDASSTRNFADSGSSKEDAWSYGVADWQADNNIIEEFMLAQGPAEVPSLPSPPASSSVGRSTRGWGYGKSFKPSDLDSFLQYDDALVVPDIGAFSFPSTHSPTSPPPKRRRIGVDF